MNSSGATRTGPEAPASAQHRAGATSGLVGRVRDRLRGTPGLDAEELVRRIDALERFLRATDDHLPAKRLVATRTVLERSGARLQLSRDHTVVALVGATGSGKSSLFNALARLELSPVGVRRPTTGTAHACVWGALDGAQALLDWVGVLPRHRFIRESPLDGDDEAHLRGLILLDLPDFDSVERSHRMEVDRLLHLVDLVIWVVDPQKYADRVVHEGYLRRFQHHRDVTVVVLNQIDRLTSADVVRVLADLTQLLAGDGLVGVPVLATSAIQPGAHGEMRELLERTVAQRQAALLRLSGDLDAAVADAAPLIGPPVAEDIVDRSTVRSLVDALAASTGVPGIAEAVRRSYVHRASGATGWPLFRWYRRLRPDPLRRLHLTGPDPTTPTAASSVPPADTAQRAAGALAVRAVARQAGADLPESWSAAVTNAARSRIDDLSDALDGAVSRTDLGADRSPLWWRVAAGVHWLCLAATLTGLVWLGAGYALRALGLPELRHPQLGQVPLPTALLLGGLLLSLLVALLLRPVVGFAARRARARAERRLRAAVTMVARDLVITPVREVLQAYAQAREALAAARRGAGQ